MASYNWPNTFFLASSQNVWDYITLHISIKRVPECIRNKEALFMIQKDKELTVRIPSSVFSKWNWFVIKTCSPLQSKCNPHYSHLLMELASMRIKLWENSTEGSQGGTPLTVLSLHGTVWVLTMGLHSLADGVHLTIWRVTALNSSANPVVLHDLHYREWCILAWFVLQFT